jgi:phosphate starvation-inducible protein PhoH and related proteins
MATKKPRKSPSRNNDIAESINDNSLKTKKLNIKQYKLTEKQKKFLQLAMAEATKLIFIEGPSGSSKTFLTVLAALQLYNTDNNYEIKYIRTIIESADKGLGSLPGDGPTKIHPFLIPLQEKLEELLPKEERKEFIKNGTIEGVPINFVRGSSWKDKIILVDEAQNFSIKELITVLTRIGENTKMLVCGDSMQSDIGAKSGFKKIMDLFNDEESAERGIHCVTFGEEDIMRSEILKFLVKKFKTLTI